MTEDWRLKALLEGGRILLKGDDILLKAAGYARPWSISHLDGISWIVRKVEPKRCVIVGAHIGETVIWVWRAGCKRILAYEPDPAYCELLYENLELNGVSADVRCEAVGTDEDRLMIQAAGGPTRIETAGIHRILRGDVDLIIMCCLECADAATKLGCEALLLPRSFMIPGGCKLEERLEGCGFHLERRTGLTLAYR